MKKLLLLSFVLVLFVTVGVVSMSTDAHAYDFLSKKLKQCRADLETRDAELDVCVAELEECEELVTGEVSVPTNTRRHYYIFWLLKQCRADLETRDAELHTCFAELVECERVECPLCPVFPGDGYPNPDAVEVSGHGPALSYTDNGDGTFTDENTGLMWEKKDGNIGIHNKDNTYNWTINPPDPTDPDGTLFTVFLDKLNTTCDGDETTSCVTDADCTVIGNGLCGHAGFRDWRIPNVKELHSILDYSKFNPSSIYPGATAFANAQLYWSVTGQAPPSVPVLAWGVRFDFGLVVDRSKVLGAAARAVRTPVD